MNLVLICLEVSAAWVSQRLQIHKIVRTKLNGTVLANSPWECRGVLVGGENNCAREREGMWNSWTLALPDGVADDHVALEEEEEDCAEFRQNIVSIGPGQLGYSGDGKMVIFIEMMVILVIKRWWLWWPIGCNGQIGALCRPKHPSPSTHQNYNELQCDYQDGEDDYNGHIDDYNDDEHSPSTHQKYNGIIVGMARMTRKMVGFLDAIDTNFAHQESCRK